MTGYSVILPEPVVQQTSHLFFNVLLPIFAQIGAGYWLQKRFKLDTATLSKIQFYILVPAVTFTSLCNTHLDANLLTGIVLCNVVLFALLLILTVGCARFGKVAPQQQRAFYNSVCLYNSGNYCIPLIQLLYGTPFSYTIQIIIMLIQSVVTNTFGVFNTAAQNRKPGVALRSVLHMPMTQAMLLAILVRLLELPVWKPIMLSLDVLSHAMVPLALITLGAQLANTRIKLAAAAVYLSAALRLLAAPALAWLLVWLWGIQGVAAQVIIICSAAPSAVNTVLLAIEFGGDAEFASQSVLASTALSALTVPLVIGLCLHLM